MKIVGYTVGTSLPKPNFAQTDPTKGDYIKNKPDFDGLQNTIHSVSELVGSEKVSKQIEDALNIDYESTLAFDVTEIVIANLAGTSSVLGQAMLGQLVLA